MIFELWCMGYCLADPMSNIFHLIMYVECVYSSQTPNILQLSPVLENSQWETREYWNTAMGDKKQREGLSNILSGPKAVAGSSLEMAWFHFEGFLSEVSLFLFFLRSLYFYTCLQTLLISSTQSPIFYLKPSNQPALSAFSWRGSFSKVAKMSQYSQSFYLVSETPGHPIGHSSYFKCTVTFSLFTELPSPSLLHCSRAF